MQADLTINKKKTKLQECGSYCLVIFLALMIRIFIIELFFVPTASMQATILENEYILSTKYSYGYSNHSLPFSPNIFSRRIFTAPPQRGDIIVFRPPHNMEVRYIKRLIGLPNDKVQLINDIIYINDQPVTRQKIGPFVTNKGKHYTKYKEILPNDVSYFSYKLQQTDEIPFNNELDNTAIFYVPEGQYFFLGDNRDESNDSRIDLGFVPFENFIAKGQFILFSTEQTFWLDNIGIIEQISRIGTWFASIRFNRIFTFL